MLLNETKRRNGIQLMFLIFTNDNVGVVKVYGATQLVLANIFQELLNENMLLFWYCIIYLKCKMEFVYCNILERILCCCWLVANKKHKKCL